MDPEALRASHGAMLEHLLSEEEEEDVSDKSQQQSTNDQAAPSGNIVVEEGTLGRDEAPLGEGEALLEDEEPSPEGGAATAATGLPADAAGQLSEEQVRVAAQKRAELLVAAQRLVPDGDFSTASDLEILQAAVGNRVPAGQRSDESYLRGVLDTVISARSQAPNGASQIASASPVASHYHRPNIMSLIAQRDSVTQRS